MARLQELLTQSTIQNLGLGQVLAVRAQEAQQIRQVMQRQAEAEAEAVKAKARGRRERGETLGALIGGGIGAFAAGKGQRLEGAALGAGIGQAAGGQLSGATRQQGFPTSADIGVQALRGGVDLDKRRRLIESRSVDEELDRQLKAAQLKELLSKPEQREEKAAKEAEKVAETKKRDFVQDKSELETVSSNIDNVLRNIDELINDPKLGAATGPQALLSVIPGSKAKDVDAQLNTIRANAAFSALQEMRNASKTGGALGQVSEKEIAFLEAKIDTLDPKQSDKKFLKNLKSVRDEFEKVKRRAEKRFLELHPQKKGTAVLKFNPETGEFE